MLSVYARMARDQHADMLVIGTGLTKMADDPDDQAQGREIIAEIRSGALMGDDRGYAGKLTYAARWDDIYADAYDPSAHQFFWDALDYVGVEGFWPLIGGADPEHDNPLVKRLRQGWTFNFLPGGMPPGAALLALHDEYQKPVLLTGLGYLSRAGRHPLLPRITGQGNGDYTMQGKPAERELCQRYRSRPPRATRVCRPSAMPG